MIKAIFFDVDGTLVSFKTHSIPQSTKDAIHEVRKKGIKVFIATGRPMPFINNLEDLEYDGIMSVTGACFCDKDGKIVYNRPVCKDDVKKITEYAKQHKMCVTFAGNEETFTIFPNEKSESVYKLLNLEPSKTQYAPEHSLDIDVLQIIAFFNSEEEKFMMDNILPNCDAHRWHPDFADCIAKGTSKATGIDEVIKHYGIELNETMAFGDGGNDIAMLSHAGIGIAMGNALDNVKKYAKIVTDSVDNNGIAKILQEIDKF
ncbi:MAG: Cof-type HAD-IIB family hydrolase [Bacteroidaceae bacterium]|nr:Cof-type HAD-IIB family hydrolase [Bacteroidaceae bacterium]